MDKCFFARQIFVKCWFYSGLKQQYKGLRQWCLTQFKVNDVSIAKHNTLPVPSSESKQDFLNPLVHARLVWQLWEPHQACLRLILMGCTLRQSFTKEIIDRAANNKCTTCVLCFSCRIAQEQCCVIAHEDNMCTTGINMAKDQGVCDSLLANTCETKTTKVCLYAYVHMNMFLCVCLIKWKHCEHWQKEKQNKITVWNKKLPPPNKCTARFTLLDSQFGGKWLMREMVYICMCVCCEQDEARHSREELSLLLSDGL